MYCFPNVTDIKYISLVLSLLLIFTIYKLMTNKVKTFNKIWLILISTIFGASALIEGDAAYFDAKDQLNNSEDVRDANVILNFKIIFIIIQFGIISSIISIPLLKYFVIDRALIAIALFFIFSIVFLLAVFIFKISLDIIFVILALLILIGIIFGIFYYIIKKIVKI